ncbi:MAG: hypothetical protein NC123_18295 [Butyrivibrio sp.]|nr:hypothetical protein [Acetatifactor muris]MCM1561463.1 hypothetical protein [Butyrivibrio sp.]
MKRRCTDEYGNAVPDLKVGAVVESDLAIFTVGAINEKPRDWLVIMDKDKPYKIKDEGNPMSNCVKSGNYAVIAPCLVFSEL